MTHLLSQRLGALRPELTGTSGTGDLLASPHGLELLSLLRVWKMCSGLLRTAPATRSESRNTDAVLVLVMTGVGGKSRVASLRNCCLVNYYR